MQNYSSVSWTLLKILLPEAPEDIDGELYATNYNSPNTAVIYFVFFLFIKFTEVSQDMRFSGIWSSGMILA
jgi:hypothetical protein